MNSSVHSVCSVNSVNSYVARTKPLSFKTTKSLVQKSLAPFQISVCIKFSVCRTVSNEAASDSIITSQSYVALVKHSVSNSKQVADLNSFNSGNIYLSSLGKFSSSVTIKCFSTFLSLLVSFLTSYCLSQVLLTFYLAYLAFRISFFFINSVKLRGFKFKDFSVNFSSDFIFYKTVHRFAKMLKFFHEFLVFFASQNLRNATIFFNILKFMKR